MGEACGAHAGDKYVQAFGIENSGCGEQGDEYSGP